MQPINIGSRRELFIDDYLIAAMRDVRLDLKKPERREAFAFDAPWEDNVAAPDSVVVDKDIVRLYYRAAIDDLRDEVGSTVTALLESTDGGRSFVRPKLGLYEFKGSRDNNIIGRGLANSGTPPPVFIDRNPDCKINERYKGLEGVPGSNIYNCRLFAKCSADGIHWRFMQDEPLVYPGIFDTINTGFWDSIAGCYRSYTRDYRIREARGAKFNVRIIQSATSSDFIHWTRPVDNRYADGEEDVQ